MTQSKTLARLLTAAGAAVLAIALFAPAAQAATPAPGYEQFTGCPTEAESPSSIICVRSEIKSGSLKMGSKEAPIKKPITLVGGINDELAGFTAGPGGGLLPAKQEVPGGVIGITGLDWLVNFLNLEALKLYAIAELAGTPSSLGLEPLHLPIKIRLDNPVLGNKCYIGSLADPIDLELITTTTNPPPPNKPISGKPAEISVDPEKNIIYLKNGTFVDNAFSVPGASGCKLTLLGFIPISLDSVVNLQAGLPAPAGVNEAIQNFNVELTQQSTVYP
jgi:hypothetical protein